MLRGMFTAMITPFRGEEIDEEGLIQNIQRQIAAGVEGMLFLGTTGELATLSEEEQNRICKIAVREAKGKARILIGTGSNCTRQTLEKTMRAEGMGADIATVITPNYNKPPQEGLFRHFEKVATSVQIPLLIDNNPGRTGVNIEPATLLRIAGLPNMIGIKESGTLGQTSEIMQLVVKQHPSFAVLSGDDTITLSMMALGAKGVISVVGNLLPERIRIFVDAALQGDFKEAERLHGELLPLFKLSFIEVNPIPIKEAMTLCGLPAGGCRLPLWNMREENREKLATLLSSMSLQ